MSSFQRVHDCVSITARSGQTCSVSEGRVDLITADVRCSCVYKQGLAVMSHLRRDLRCREMKAGVLLLPLTEGFKSLLSHARIESGNQAPSGMLLSVAIALGDSD